MPRRRIMLAAAKDAYPIDRAGRSRCDSSEITRGAKILLVDRHFLIREALRAVLKELNNNLTILEAENPSCAMQIISDHKDINFVFLEVDLPDQHGISVL